MSKICIWFFLIFFRLILSICWNMGQYEASIGTPFDSKMSSVTQNLCRYCFMPYTVFTDWIRILKTSNRLELNIQWNPWNFKGNLVQFWISIRLPTLKIHGKYEVSRLSLTEKCHFCRYCFMPYTVFHCDIPWETKLNFPLRMLYSVWSVRVPRLMYMAKKWLRAARLPATATILP